MTGEDQTAPPSETNVDARAPNQSTALMLAARNGHRGVVEALVKAGADISLVNENGLTAAAWARENKNTDIAEYLESRAPAAARQRVEAKPDSGKRKMKVLIE